MKKSITKYGAVETAIEYLMSSGDTRHMGIAVRDAILKLEAAQQPRAVDSPEPCGNYTPAFLVSGSPCLNCNADAASH